MRAVVRLATVVSLAASRLGAQGSDSVVSVNLNRTTSVPSHRAIAYVSTEGNAESARDAITRANTALATVVTALQRVTGVSVGTPRIMSVGDNPALRGYPAAQMPTPRVARAIVRIEAQRPEALMEAIAAALDAGAKAASTLTFESLSADSARRTLLREATAEAHREAEILAQALGGRLGPLLGAGSNAQGPWQQQTTLNFEGVYGQPQPAEVQVNVSVSLRYRLLPR